MTVKVQRLVSLLFFSLLGIGIEAPMSFAGDKETKIIYKYAYDVPTVLEDKLYRNLKYEDYLRRVLSEMKYLTGKINNFTKSDWNGSLEKELLKKRYDRLVQVIRNDRNFDGIITLDEVYRRIVERGATHSAVVYSLEEGKRDFGVELSAKDTIKQYDNNGDGQIDTEEMSYLPPDKEAEVERLLHKRFAPYFRCDANGDGVLTVAEIEKAAKAAFAFYDKDRNGVLSNEEYAVLGKR